MRFESLPTDLHPLREDVGDVEDRREPCVPISSDIDIIFHPSDTGIAQIGTIENAERVEQEDQGHDMPVEFGDDAFLFFRSKFGGWNNMAAAASFFGFNIFDGLDAVFLIRLATVRSWMASGRFDVLFVHYTKMTGKDVELASAKEGTVYL